MDLLWDSRGTFQSDELDVPHRELEQRGFALGPLLDVAPELDERFGPMLEAVGGRPARWADAPPAATARAHAGNHRLHRRWQSFDARSKQPSVANVAIARELAGWCWSLAVMDD